MIEVQYLHIRCDSNTASLGSSEGNILRYTLLHNLGRRHAACPIPSPSPRCHLACAIGSAGRLKKTNSLMHLNHFGTLLSKIGNASVSYAVVADGREGRSSCELSCLMLALPPPFRARDLTKPWA
jgi:hypothetical protein